MKIGKYGDLEHKFEMEHDGQYYRIEAMYHVERDHQTTDRGTRVLENIVASGFLVYADSAQLLVTDQALMNAIWRECDKYAKYAR